MFNKQNFCHVASNNRNEQKAGIFVYRTTDNLQTVTASGYFNEKLVDINLHDLIIHEQTDNADKTKVVYNILCVTERTLDNVGTQTILTDWEKALVVPTKLSDLTGDVAIVNPTNGQQLVYNSTTQKWENAAGGSGLPDQTGNAGKFLTTDGTDASWSDKPLVNSATGNVNAIAIKGTASGTNSVSIGQNSSTYANQTAVAVGSNSKVFKISGVSVGGGSEVRGDMGVAIGANTYVQANYGVAIGLDAAVTATNAIQISAHNYNSRINVVNSDANTVKIANANGNFEIMSADGTIPESRLADTTSATQGQVLTLDSNLDAVWADASSGGSGLNVGDIFFTMRNDNGLNGAVECDGATYNTTDFTGAESIGALLEAGKLDYISLSAYSTAISTKGWCDKIGWDGAGNTVFRVPTLNAHIVQTNNIPVVGNGMTLGLTDGTDNAGINSYANSTGLDPWTGLYGTSVGTASSGSRVTANKSMGITTDPTKSGIIADTTDTAQLRVMIQLATGATDTALETCTSVLADVATLKGYDYVVESQLPTAANNYTWYRKYKSGWVEQGGLNHTISLNSNGYNNMIDLPVTMADTQYAATAILSGAYGNRTIGHVPSNSTTTQVCIGGYASQAGTSAVNWQVSGMSAS